jgi:ethanolamine transporter EutH
MAVVSFPFWLIFAILSPVLILFFVLGAGLWFQPQMQQKPAIIEKYPS